MKLLRWEAWCSSLDARASLVGSQTALDRNGEPVTWYGNWPLQYDMHERSLGG